MEVYPTYWKTSFITPIHKSGDRANICNYRLVSIISKIPKIVESIITTKITLLSNNITSNYQHRFTTEKSTTTILAWLSHYINNAIDNYKHIDVIYTDFSKAFDRVGDYV